MELVNALIIIISIVFLEMLLSVDNTVVISMIANKAKPEDRDKVVKYGIIGAFVFRGLALFLVSWLMSNPEWGGLAKLVGGWYLIKLGKGILTPEVDVAEEGEIPQWVEKLFSMLKMSALIVVIMEVEIVDFIFSIDNLFSAVAFTENVQGEFYGYPLKMILTILGVFLGIITMRWVTKKIMKLIDKYPSLNASAGIVIVLLGIKLCISALLVLLKPNVIGYLNTFLSKGVIYAEKIAPYMENHYTDFGFSALMMLIFVFPIIRKK